jgi:hypothetical protein
MRKIISYIVFLMLGCLDASAVSYTFDVDKGIVFSWQYDDIVGFYTTKGTRIKHWALAVSDDGKSSSFSSYGWSLVENSQYYIYYPYNNTYFEKGMQITELPIAFDGQVQKENHSLEHIAAYDYMMGQGSVSESTADFTLNHLCAIVRVEFVSPKSAVYTEVSLKTQDDVFCQNAIMNLKAQSINTTARSNNARVRLDGIAINEGETLEAYMVVAPVNLSGKPLSLVVVSEDGEEITYDVQMNELKAGMLYNLECTEYAVPFMPNKEFNAKRRAGSLVEPFVRASDIPLDPDAEIIVTGIHETIQNEAKADETLYTLSGMRTKKSSAKGIVISKGKKMIIRK